MPALSHLLLVFGAATANRDLEKVVISRTPQGHFLKSFESTGNSQKETPVEKKAKRNSKKKFKVKLVSISKCDAPAEKLDPTEPVVYETSAKNLNKHTKVVKTNFTVLRPAGPVRMSLHIYSLRLNSRKDEIFKMENVDCHNPVTYQLVRVINVRLDNDCMAVPGNYLTENINVQDFAWILTKAMIYPGKYEYLLEFYSAKGLAACNDMICDIQESK